MLSVEFWLKLYNQWATHSSTLAWKIPWTEERGGLQSMGSWRVWCDWATSLSFFLSCIGKGNGNPLQCSCLENPRDGGAWWAAVFGVTQSRSRLKWLSSSYKHYLTKENSKYFPLCQTGSSSKDTWSVLGWEKGAEHLHCTPPGGSLELCSIWVVIPTAHTLHRLRCPEIAAEMRAVR